MYLHAGKLESIIKIMTTDTGNVECFTPDGKIHTYNDDCLLFPSKEQRDWSKFNVKKQKD